MGSGSSDPISELCCAKRFDIKATLEDGNPTIVDSYYYINESLIAKVQKKAKAFIAMRKYGKLLDSKLKIDGQFSSEDNKETLN